MLKSLSVCSLLLVWAASAYAMQTDTSVIRLSEPVLSDANSETFGASLDKSIPLVNIQSLLNEPNTYIGKPILLETKVAKVCQKKGCFFVIQHQDKVIRVSFKDYEFFIPSDSGGKTVLLTGELIKKDISAEQAAHFTQDLQMNTSGIKAGVVYELVANSVKIPKNVTL